jgi:hypothetical protein
MLKKVKLRDLTEKQYEDWLNHHCDRCSDCFFNDISCNKLIRSCWIKHKELYSDEFLNKTVEVETPDILQPSERDYLDVKAGFEEYMKHAGDMYNTQGMLACATVLANYIDEHSKPQKKEEQNNEKVL